VGSGTIVTNDATIELIGAKSSFAKLAGLGINAGSLTVGQGASLTDKSLYNTGTLTVTQGGTIDIVKSANLSNGILTGGTWIVDGSLASSKTAAPRLIVGSGNITTNNANIELIGAYTNFAQLAGLSKNKGTLTIGPGATLNDKSLYNTGTLTAAGGTISITNSKNLSGTTLTGGTWVVDSSGGTAAKLVIGSAKITTNDANIELIGAHSSFAQLAGLNKNEGSLTIGAGNKLSTSVSLNNTGTLVTGVGGTLSINTKQTLQNDGLITNNGTLQSTGDINGKGTFNNTGTLAVLSGGNVDITHTGNLSGGTLTGGTWVVDSTNTTSKLGGSATLVVGKGSITTNNATIELLGTSSKFAQLAGLTTNAGSLSIGNGAQFHDTSLNNTGTLTVTRGGSIDIGNSDNLSAGKLTGGTWIVDTTAIGNGPTSLTVGGGAVLTNDATIELLGSGAVWNQINSLHVNTGSLTIGSGAVFNDKSSLYNTGTLMVSQGSSVQILQSGNLAGGTLTGGTWIVDGSGTYSKSATTRLVVGSGAISTNNATIELIGPNASFAQLAGLATNKGSLTIGTGAVFNDKSLYNTGTLSASGGSIDITKSKNFANGRLKDGTWIVDSSAGTAAKMVVGSGNIVNNDAAIELLGAKSSFAQLDSLATNSGSLTVGAGASFTTSADLLNTGSLTVSSGGSVNVMKNFTQDSGVTTVNDGAVLSAKKLQFLGGVLTGSGSIDPPNTIDIGANATVTPTGTLTLQGDTVFDGTLDINIGGPADFGVLNDLGSIFFGAGSTIDFNFAPGFNMTDPTYAFQFLDGRNGIEGLNNVVFDYTGLSGYSSQLAANCAPGSGCEDTLLLSMNGPGEQVPEPGTILLTVSGLLGLFVHWWRRRTSLLHRLS